MVKGFIELFKVFFNFLKYPFYGLLIFLAIFITCCSFFFLFDLFKGKRLKKGVHKFVKKENFLYKIFVKLPRQIVDDYFERDPDFFPYQGCVIFEGRQGAGKTIGMVEFIMRMQNEYPKALCTTNLAYLNEDTELGDWRMLLNYKNGIYGVIVAIDELQNWISSMDSKNFPPDMLEIITQNRKNRRILLGTAQNFYLLAKAIRSQATEVRRCTTILGACTIVRRFEPILDSEGNVKEFKKRGWYFFVHDKKLRDCYDTYKVIKRLTKVGFQDKPSDVVTNVFNVVQK